MYSQDPITSGDPSETRWTSHGRAWKAFYKGCKQWLYALTLCYNKRKESEALGLFILTVIIATLLMLMDMFNCIRPLILFLQKRQDSLYINETQTIVDLTLLDLKNALPKKTYFTQEEYDKINSQA